MPPDAPGPHGPGVGVCKCSLTCDCTIALQVELRSQDLSWEHFLGAVPPSPPLRAHVADGEEVTGVIFSSGTTGGLVGLCEAAGSMGFGRQTWRR